MHGAALLAADAVWNPPETLHRESHSARHEIIFPRTHRLVPVVKICGGVGGSRFDWTPIMENGYMIGVQQNGQSVTLEPGGQFELSGARVSRWWS